MPFVYPRCHYCRGVSGGRTGRKKGARDADRASGDPVPGWASNTYVQEVVAASVRVFFYEKGYLHAKTISIGSEICSIGSANIDIRSFSINYEINAVLYSKQLRWSLRKTSKGISLTVLNLIRRSISREIRWSGSRI